VEELMAVCGIDVSGATIRCWTTKFGPPIAWRLKTQRWAPTLRWHLDEMICRIAGKQMCRWRAFDDEGEVLNVLVQPGGMQGP